MVVSPDLLELFNVKFDARFMFDRFNVPFLRTLLEQQEEIKSSGRKRRVLLLFDDVETDSEESNYLGFLSTRHRHYDISMMYAAVRYSCVNKTYRASTDVLFLFNVPMYSDRKMLLLEHSSNKGLAAFAMKSLEKHSCLVMESGYKQKLFFFRAPSFKKENTENLCEATQNSTNESRNKTETQELLPSETAEDDFDLLETTNNAAVSE